MREISLPQGYSSLLSVYETQKAIGLLKRLFADKLSGALRLHRVSAPLFVSAETGLNDDYNVEIKSGLSGDEEVFVNYLVESAYG